MNTEQGSFGFGQNVTGGTAAEPIVVHDRAELVAELAKPLDGKVIEIGARDGGNYDFRNAGAGQQLVIAARNFTIRAQQNVNSVLQNVQLRVDLDRSDNILFENLTFRSDGAKDNARDAIVLVATRPAEGVTASGTASVRITRCSFDGHYDIAIDSQGVAGRPELLATIDRCLFFDSRPGRRGEGQAKFFNRGAINITVADAEDDGDENADDDGSSSNKAQGNEAPRPLGNSRVTVAYNVFIDVWRRSPRVAEGNVAHVFNNLLYRWGFTESPSDDPTWRGMEVGGGVSGPRGNNGRALIQANRFIPWDEKLDPTIAIKVHRGTSVDFGVTRSDPDQPATPDDARPNRFDTPQGGVPKTPQRPDAKGNLALINIISLYGTLTAPNVLRTGDVQWETDILANAGPAGGDATAKTRLQQVLQNA